MKSCLLISCAVLVSAQAASAQHLPAAAEGTTRIAVLGCLRQDEPAPALSRYVASQPDLALWVGDNVYADTEDDPAFIQECYDTLAALPGFAALRAQAPYAATWDDHDFGLNNEGADYPLKRASANLFRRFWQLEDAIPADREGIYHAQRYAFGGHTLHVVLLDVRYHRDAPGAQADMLGEAQWAWLAETLQEPADLTLIVSGTQLLLPEETGSENWAAYPQARARLIELVRRARCERVLFVTGDQHYAEVARLPRGLDFDLVELQFAGVNQIESPEFNPYRVAPAADSRHSVGLIDVQWEANEYDPAHLLYRVFDAETGDTEIAYRVNFSELELGLHIAPPYEFVDTANITMRNPHPHLTVHYTLDGSVPLATSSTYPKQIPVMNRRGDTIGRLGNRLNEEIDGGVRIAQTTTVRAALFTPDGWPRSAVVTTEFRRVQPVAAIASKPTDPGLRFTYYEGAFERLPRFDTLTPRGVGIARSFDVAALADREDHYAILFEGYLEVSAPGMYRFEVESDDGSRLYLHGRQVVDNDGSHSARTRAGRMALAPGLHPLRLEYFEDYMGQELELRWYGPGGAHGAIPFQQLRH